MGEGNGVFPDWRSRQIVRTAKKIFQSLTRTGNVALTSLTVVGSLMFFFPLNIT